MNNKELIKEAAKAIWATRYPESRRDLADAAWEEVREIPEGIDVLEEARAAFAVFEKAHTPTDDEQGDRTAEFANMAAIMGLPEPQDEPSDALLSRIEQARVMVGLFRAWNVTPEQIETLRGILASAERIANGTAGIGREVER